MRKANHSELAIIGLATEMQAGLAAHVDVFPEPPVPATELATILAQFQQVMGLVTTARSNAEALTAQKLEVLEQIVEKIRVNSKYADLVTGGSDEKLKLIGLSGRKPSEPVALPGQPRQLAVYPQGESWLELQWMSPAEGGKVQAYRVKRRLRSEEHWEEIASAFGRTITLQNQPRKVELEYCVVASNNSGDGPMSNTVMVVL